jgi:hypothetical protein
MIVARHEEPMEISSPLAARTPLWHAMHSVEVTNALACSAPGCGFAAFAATQKARPTQMKTIRTIMIYKAF